MIAREIWFNIFKDLKIHGKEYSPRGMKTLEIENYMFELNPITDKLCCFTERKVSLKYLAKEFLWYLSADRNNTLLEEYAPFWKTVKNKKEPYYNSNYGYYFFAEKQFDYVVETLIIDKDSRQAVILLNRKEVMMSDSVDKICTNAISFRIRDNKLNMSVTMRSSDLIWGITNDVVQFSLLYEMVYNKLKFFYKSLEIGIYNHKSDSFHIYERHFKMLDAIINSNGENWNNIKIPLIESAIEVETLITQKFNLQYNFSSWLLQI